MGQAIEALSGVGAEYSEIELSEDFDTLLDAQWTILLFEIARTLEYERTAHHDQLSDRLRDLLDRGMTVLYPEYAAALDLAGSCRAKIAPLFDQYVALVTPSAAGEAPVGLQAPKDLFFQRQWTVLHLPCVSLPGLIGEAGLPVGIQLVSDFRDEQGLLAVAR